MLSAAAEPPKRGTHGAWLERAVATLYDELHRLAEAQLHRSHGPITLPNKCSPAYVRSAQKARVFPVALAVVWRMAAGMTVGSERSQ
jgi:hypothetical protein